MGVKSTRTITRATAETNFIDRFIEKKTADRREKILPRARAAGIDDDYDLKQYLRIDARLREDGWRMKARVKIARMDDTTLENELEWLNDEVNGGEGFENYIISERPEED